MQSITTEPNVAQPFLSVNPQSINNVSTPPKLMIHHKVPPPSIKIIYRVSKNYRGRSYGVSSSSRVLTPSLFIKRFNLIRDCLKSTMGLTTSQREVAIRLLRYWAYYGKVYPKESTVTELPGCSKATFWRTIKLLQDMELIQVINRYIIRPHAQISNLYRFDKLLIILARYLAEHGVHFWEKWLEPYLQVPGRGFWAQVWQTPAIRAAPSGSIAVSC